MKKLLAISLALLLLLSCTACRKEPNVEVTEPPITAEPEPTSPPYTDPTPILNQFLQAVVDHDSNTISLLTGSDFRVDAFNNTYPNLLYIPAESVTDYINAYFSVSSYEIKSTYDGTATYNAAVTFTGKDIATIQQVLNGKVSTWEMDNYALVNAINGMDGMEYAPEEIIQMNRDYRVAMAQLDYEAIQEVDTMNDYTTGILMEAVDENTWKINIDNDDIYAMSSGLVDLRAPSDVDDMLVIDNSMYVSLGLGSTFQCSGTNLSSSNPEVATVDSAGVVTAVSTGVAVITGDDTTMYVGVRHLHDGNQNLYSLYNNQLYLEIGNTAYVPMVYKGAASSSYVMFTSGNEEVCTVDETGMITVTGSGKAHVYIVTPTGLFTLLVSVAPFNTDDV